MSNRISLRHGLGALAAALAGAAASSAWAIGQGSVTPPGGFASACAASIAGTNVMAYGGDLPDSWSWPGYAGKFDCTSNGFSGAAGSATAGASFAAPKIANSSSSQAQMGLLRQSAANSSPANTQFAQGAANGGWSDRTTVVKDGLSGSAIWLFDVAISGSLLTHGGATGFGATAYKNTVELSRYVTGFDPGSSDVFTTDRQRVRWSAVAPNNTADVSRTVDDLVTFAVPVTLGTSFVWGVYGSTYAGQRAMTTGDGRIETAEADFTHTLRFMGSRGVLVGGTLYTDFDLRSDSGIDWHNATPVPEPATGALALAGLLGVASIVRRRRMH